MEIHTLVFIVVACSRAGLWTDKSHKVHGNQRRYFGRRKGKYLLECILKCNMCLGTLLKKDDKIWDLNEHIKNQIHKSSTRIWPLFNGKSKWSTWKNRTTLHMEWHFNCPVNWLSLGVMSISLNKWKCTVGQIHLLLTPIRILSYS